MKNTTRSDNKTKKDNVTLLFQKSGPQGKSKVVVAL